MEHYLLSPYCLLSQGNFSLLGAMVVEFLLNSIHFQIVYCCKLVLVTWGHCLLSPDCLSQSNNSHMGALLNFIDTQCTSKLIMLQGSLNNMGHCLLLPICLLLQDSFSHMGALFIVANLFIIAR